MAFEGSAVMRKAAVVLLAVVVVLGNCCRNQVAALDPSEPASSRFSASLSNEASALSNSGIVEANAKVLGTHEGTLESRNWPKKYTAFNEREVARDLIRWLRSNGVSAIGGPEATVRLEIDYNTTARASGKSRGNFRLVAARNISAGQPVLSVPLSLAVTADLASKGLPRQPEGQGEVWAYSQLAAWLLRERAKGKESTWEPYISSLPQYVPVPYVFSEDMVYMFEYPPLIKDTSDMAQGMASQYQMLGTEVVASATEKEFLWAFSVVMSRMFSLIGPFAEALKASLKKLPPSSASGANEESVVAEELEVEGEDGEAEEEDSWEEEFLLQDSDNQGKMRKERETKEHEEEKRDGAYQEVPILLPLADLCDSDEDATAIWEIDAKSSAMVIRALSDITVGDPILLPRAAMQNEQHLTVHGHIPKPFNRHDGIELFSTRQEAINFFREKFLAGKFTEEHRWVMDDTFDLAEEFIGIELKKDAKYAVNTSKLEHRETPGRNSPLHAWWGARVEARLLAGIAACHSITLNNKTPEYEQLAIAAIQFGWITDPRLSCDSFAAWIDDLNSDSFPVAGTAIRIRAASLLKTNFTSTMEEDDNGLAVVNACREHSVFGQRGRSSPEVEEAEEKGFEELCQEELVNMLPELELVFQFRLSKKIILKQLVSRLAARCEM